jgi:hypothetical protein
VLGNGLFHEISHSRGHKLQVHIFFDIYKFLEVFKFVGCFRPPTLDEARKMTEENELVYDLGPDGLRKRWMGHLNLGDEFGYKVRDDDAVDFSDE